MLYAIGATPSPRLVVTTATGKAISGQLLRDEVGNKQTAKGWSSYGSIWLATQDGKVEIDYLDIVIVQTKPVPEWQEPVWLNGGLRTHVDRQGEQAQVAAMLKRKEPELTPAEQKKRFEALAREVGVKQSPEEFKKALRITLAKGKKSPPRPK
jgi:hypothetical protein